MPAAFDDVPTDQPAGIYTSATRNPATTVQCLAGPSQTLDQHKTTAHGTAYTIINSKYSKIERKHLFRSAGQTFECWLLKVTNRDPSKKAEPVHLRRYPTPTRLQRLLNLQYSHGIVKMIRTASLIRQLRPHQRPDQPLVLAFLGGTSPASTPTATCSSPRIAAMPIHGS